MAKHMDWPAYYDSMPLDISFAFGDEKPAGKHGFVRAEGESLVFADGTPARFWGVCFNGGANFPSHEYAEKVAARLAMTGINMVRCHQLDTQWHTPNIFAFTRGKKLTSTRALDPVSMDRLDYLLFCLKREGIYIYMDNIVLRKFKAGDGVEKASELADGAKPYGIFDETLISLQEEYCTQLWSHMNPYTGLAYKDDPAIVLTEIANECDLFAPKGRGWHTSPYYEQKFRLLFRAWLEEKGQDYDWENCEFFGKDQPLLQFKMELTERYLKRMYAHLRAIGVRIPIAGTNWTHGAPASLPPHKAMDFCDSHHYYYDWRWEEGDRYYTNAQINGYRFIFPNLSQMRLNGRPYFVSEWGMPWPNGYRAEGSVYYPAVCALQGWSGMTIHTYSYSPHTDRMDRLGREASSETINGVGARSGPFSCWNDPAVYGLFYHAALMVRRQDVSPADKKVGVYHPDLKKFTNTAFQEGLEMHRMASLLAEEEPAGCDLVVQEADHLEGANKPVIRSDNGQLWRDISKKFGAVDTKRTKILYGKLTERRNGVLGPVETTRVDGFVVEAVSDYGVIALSSLTDAPIEGSDNLLLSTIGRATNTGFAADGDRVMDAGSAPIRAEVIEAKLTIGTRVPDLQVWAINAEGNVVGEVPSCWEDGQLTFTVGQTHPSCYYLICND